MLREGIHYLQPVLLPQIAEESLKRSLQKKVHTFTCQQMTKECLYAHTSKEVEVKCITQ